jgi:ribosomal protein L11 methyltransferase
MVLPPWEAGLDTGARLPLLLQPGMAFGTGHHPTTALILEALQSGGDLPEGGRLLDIGCGSGILSMGAVLLGAGEALAFDYDRDAVVSAAENLALNGLEERVRLAQARFPDLPWPGPFPLILANVYFTFFDQNAEAVRDLLGPDGVLLASGIQEEQGAETVERLQAAGFEARVAASRHGWVLVRAVSA